MSSINDSDLQLITALRYDTALLSAPFNTATNGGTPSAFLLLPYHFDRLSTAATSHGSEWTHAREILTRRRLEDACVRAVDEHGGKGPFKAPIFIS
jgi:4-amino-4-deoxychorismate lyase